MTAEARQSAPASRSEAPPIVLRPPAWARYLSLIGTLFVGLASLAMLGFTVAVLFEGPGWVAAFLAAITIFMAALTDYGLRDLLGKWGLRVALQPDRIVLDLPAGRSLIHRLSAQHLSFAFSDIEAIETRLEAYPSQGMEIMQRAFVLVPKHGDPVFLFEDRALGTLLSSPMYGPIADAIVARAGVPLRDLGMVEGRGGVLSVWGTHAPAWAAPSMPLSRQQQVWRRVGFTGKLATGALLAAFAIRFILAL
jgi:hypothetical protein